jgi:hypothetical protein
MFILAGNGRVKIRADAKSRERVTLVSVSLNDGEADDGKGEQNAEYGQEACQQNEEAHCDEAEVIRQPSPGDGGTFLESYSEIPFSVGNHREGKEKGGPYENEGKNLDNGKEVDSPGEEANDAGEGQEGDGDIGESAGDERENEVGHRGGEKEAAPTGKESVPVGLIAFYPANEIIDVASPEWTESEGNPDGGKGKDGE